LADDAAGSQGFTPRELVDYELLGAEALGGDTNVNVDVPSIEQRAAEAVSAAKGDPTGWQAGPLSQGLQTKGFYGNKYPLPEEHTGTDIAGALFDRFRGQAEGTDSGMPEITPEFLQLLREHTKAKLADDPDFYSPQEPTGLLDSIRQPEGAHYGRSLLNMLLADPDVTPDQLTELLRTLQTQEDERRKSAPLNLAPRLMGP